MFKVKEKNTVANGIHRNTKQKKIMSELPVRYYSRQNVLKSR